MVKPAPTTPLSTLKFAELVADLLPKGVLNIITDANDLGEAMTKHPDIRKISFTGSTATGQKVMASAAETLKRITLELGGNDASIVLDDADPKKVAPASSKARSRTRGQVCLAIKRLYVHGVDQRFWSSWTPRRVEHAIRRAAEARTCRRNSTWRRLV